MRFQFMRVGLAIAFAYGLAFTAHAAPVDAARIVAADKEPGNWLTHGRTYSEQRFSPLTGISVENVKNLSLEWSYDVNVRNSKALESTPIVVDGVLYFTTTFSNVVAVEAKTGRKLWEFDPKVDGGINGRACCGPVNRGVAVWKDKVYLGAYDGRLIALDARSGKKVWETWTVDNKGKNTNYTITGAPRVIKGKVLIGNGGAETGKVRGYISAYDADTGKQLWRFYTVPGDPAKGFEDDAQKQAAATWYGEWWKLGGGGTVWDSFSYDPELDLLYIGTGNSSPYNRNIRSEGKGDNLYLASIVALRPDTGKYVWHFQQTPGDEWDFTSTQHIILADLTIDGQARKTILHAPKNGFFYVIDRVTGKFISGQPFAKVTWAKGLDPATGRPIEVPEARYSTTGKPFVVFPSPWGAHNWQPSSFNPQTGLVYIPALEVGFGYVNQDKKDFQWKYGQPNLGIDLVKGSMPEDPGVRAQIRAGSVGKLIAWDPIAQKARWTVDQPTPWNGGTLTTAGNLVFQGDAQGHFIGYRADTGEKVWDYHVQSGVIAPPITYQVDGEQYVTLLAGWGGSLANVLGEVTLNAVRDQQPRVLTFKLGGTARLPEFKVAERRLDPVANTAPEAVVTKGKQLYQQICILCHGDSGVNGGSNPDLRYSAKINDPALFKASVLDGKQTHNGMPAYARQLDKEGAEAIRAYLIKRANDEKTNLAAAKQQK
jgi:PQQ-dependent dehydrogenase (methanol/ethanol family)